MIGSRLGPYEVTGKLGQGGMGEVFRATDARLRREVALKVLPAHFTDDAERLARFEREAQLLAQLHHPNVASIFGLEESGSVRALVMELVEGEDLTALIERGPLPIDEARSIARQVAEALEVAHEAGIVHRDLKPGNVKVRADGTVKVLDFGLAKASEGGGSSPGRAPSASLMDSPTLTAVAGTRLGVILGTAAYMAPEQARGLAVDKRADVWAFGAVLYEMLTGRRLFGGETASDTLAAVLRQEIDWTALPAELSDADRRLLARCLERDPRRRLRDIGEARIAFEGPAVAAPPPGATPAATRGRAGWMVAVAATAGLALGFGIAALARPRASERAAGSELRITPITSSGNVIAAAISPDGRYVAHVEAEQGMQSLWLQQLAGGQTLRLIADRNVGYWGHTFTPDGNRIVFGEKSDADPKGALYSISTLGGAPRRLLEDIDSTVSFSPDGRRMAFLRLGHPAEGQSALMVAAADGSGVTALASFRPPEQVAGIFFAGPAWSPDGRRIATVVQRRGSASGEGRARLVLVAVDDGAVTTLADPGWESAAQAAWLPDGGSLVLVARASDQANAQIWSVSVPGGESRRVTSDLNDHRIVSLSADGRSLVSVAGIVSSAVWAVPLRGPGQPRRLSRSRLDGLTGVTFSPAGNVVYTSNAGTSWGLWSASADGAELAPLLAADESALVVSPVVGGDGTHFFALRSRAGVHIRALPPDGSAVRDVARDAVLAPFDVSRDGRVLVYGAIGQGPSGLFAMAPDGSGRRRVFPGVAGRPALDPSGTKVAFYYTDPEGRARIGVQELAGGALVVDVPAVFPSATSRLVLRDEGVYLNTVPTDRSNVWILPAAGGAPRRVTDFPDQVLYDFALSPDGATLAVARGPRLRDAHLITGFAGGQFSEPRESGR